jgi:hypothetical protein
MRPRSIVEEVSPTSVPVPHFGGPCADVVCWVVVVVPVFPVLPVETPDVGTETGPPPEVAAVVG